MAPASDDAEALLLPDGLAAGLSLELLAESLLLLPQPLSIRTPATVSNESDFVLFHFIELPP
jgi:hypothetical protein